jgi:macrodomain Ter protein organizer (MatP/YcbG family)
MSQMPVGVAWQSLAQRNNRILEMLMRVAVLSIFDKKEKVWKYSNEINSMQKDILTRLKYKG